MPAPLAHYQGRIVPLDQVQVPALDRGFLFGDGVYEVLRVYQGRPWLEQEHWDRLTRSLAEIRIPRVDLANLRKRMHETIAAGPFGESMVYIQITRGSAPRRKHAFPAEIRPLELLWVEDYDDGATAARRKTGVSVITYPDLRWHRCDIKSTNLLANILANQASAEKDAAEALLVLPDGTLSEGSHSSFFWVSRGVLYTTPVKDNILPGITRQFLCGLAAREGIACQEAHLSAKDVFGVDELFLSGTTSEVLPISRVDDRPIAGGQVGPVTRRLQAAHERAVQSWLHG